METCARVDENTDAESDSILQAQPLQPLQSTSQSLPHNSSTSSNEASSGRDRSRSNRAATTSIADSIKILEQFSHQQDMAKRGSFKKSISVSGGMGGAGFNTLNREVVAGLIRPAAPSAFRKGYGSHWSPNTNLLFREL